MTVVQTLLLEEMTCGGCGILFAVPSDWIANKRKEGGEFHCPNGCNRVFRESLADKLKKQLETKERELREAKCETLRQQQLKEAEMMAKAKVERKLKRVANGVCPCCQRSFTNLARHMATKHGKETHPQN